MREPSLDKRHRDKSGEIRQKRGDALNKNLSKPIPQFAPNATLGDMRKATGRPRMRSVLMRRARYSVEGCEPTAASFIER
jgi:hypothetical protein